MENEIKPKVLLTVHNLTKDYNKLLKYQKEKLECILSGGNFSSSKEKNYKKTVENILENIKSFATFTFSSRRVSAKTLCGK